MFIASVVTSAIALTCFTVVLLVRRDRGVYLDVDYDSVDDFVASFGSDLGA